MQVWKGNTYKKRSDFFFISVKTYNRDDKKSINIGKRLINTYEIIGG